MLTSGDATLALDTAAGGVGGLSSFLNGGVEHLNLVGYFYRMGGTGGETSIFSLPLVSQSQPAADNAIWVFENGDLRFEFELSLADSSTQSTIDEIYRVENKTGQTLNLFRYSDFELGSTPDSSIIAQNGYPVGFPPSFNSAVGIDQTDGVNTLSTDSVLNFSANSTPVYYETADSGSLLAGLADGSPTNYSTTRPTPHNTAGPGDLSAATQWVVSGSQSSFTGTSKSILDYPTPLAIPEPTAWLVFSGLGMWVSHRHFSCRA